MYISGSRATTEVEASLDTMVSFMHEFYPTGAPGPDRLYRRWAAAESYAPRLEKLNSMLEERRGPSKLTLNHTAKEKIV